MQTGASGFNLGCAQYQVVQNKWQVRWLREKGLLVDNTNMTDELLDGRRLTTPKAAAAAGLISSYPVAAQNLFDSGLYIYIRSLIWQLLNIYSIRMSAVFMISL